MPWAVEKLDLRLADGEVHVWVALPTDTRWVCPDCHAGAPIHDHRERVWRHLDTCQDRTLVHARVPRLTCPTLGIRQLRVPWAEEGSRFTALFEALAIDWMKQAAVATVAERLRLSWDEAAGMQARARQRGLARRQATPAAHLGIDETAFARRHQYVSVVTDLDRARVLHVADDRRRESLDAFWRRANQTIDEVLEPSRAPCSPRATTAWWAPSSIGCGIRGASPARPGATSSTAPLRDQGQRGVTRY